MVGYSEAVCGGARFGAVRFGFQGATRSGLFRRVVAVSCTVRVSRLGGVRCGAEGSGVVRIV